MNNLFSKKAKSLILICIWAFIFTFTPHAALAFKNHGFVIRIECFPGGSITVQREAEPPIILGKVVQIPKKTRWPSFTASKWGTPGTVVASAVNALHILVSLENGHGRTISILPQGTIAPAAGKSSYILTTIPPGHSIFGAWAPTVGSKVKPNLNKQYKDILKEPWVLEIHQKPKVSPYFVEIENRPGGRITLWTSKGPSILGRVIKPVSGSGRFQGTLFQDKGRIRANHPGVIDISTSPKGQIGGFQILPLEHAASREMHSAWKLTQWLIVAPYKGKFVGSAPLFNSYFVPGPARGEKLWDLWSTYGRKSLVLVRINGGKWSWMPKAVGKKDYALANITHIRIYFPFTDPLLAEETRR